jgi:hypothetical protein
MTMYGRPASLRMAEALLRRAAEQGAGGMLLVDGEPGTGKSLLPCARATSRPRPTTWPASPARCPTWPPVTPGPRPA